MTTLSAERRTRDRTPMQKMRKGTHSCSECRRRKVKCIYVVGQDRCKECRFRGSNCVEQLPNNGNISCQKTKSMRERISELETLVQALLAGQMTDSANHSRAYIDDVEYSTPISVANSPEVNVPPLMRFFDNHVITPVNHQAIVDGSSHSSGPSTPSSLIETTASEFRSENLKKARNNVWSDPKASKDEYTRKKLLECIDFGKGLDDAFQKNEQRWIIWRTRILADPPNESFADWGKSVIRDGSPSDLGTLILLLSTGSERMSSKSLIPLVATLITSDDDYTTTLSGIECSLLLSDYHCNIGQPRRAWLAIQRGLASAQLIGLHRQCSPTASGMALSLHYENQFLSLMLGVPCGINFCHNIEYAKEDIRFFKSALCNICNKYLVATEDRREAPLSLVLELDQQLQALIFAMPTEWKKFQTERSDLAEAFPSDLCLDKILIQIHMQQLRTYLYLPLILGSSLTQPLHAPMYEMSRIACLHSSRELLRLYHSLAHHSLFEHALLDFTGFSATMLIILDLLGYPKFQMEDEDSRRAANRDEQDWEIVETTISILADKAKSHDSKVIRQSLRVLRTLSGIREPDCIVYPGCRYRFVVPFFGEILAQPGEKFSFVNGSNSTSTTSEAETVHRSDLSKDVVSRSASTNASNCSNIVHARSPITISEFSGWHASSTIHGQSGHTSNMFTQGLENIESGDSLSEMLSLDLRPEMQQWQYLPDMDLNQDWLFLAEPSTGYSFVRTN